MGRVVHTIKFVGALMIFSLMVTGRCYATCHVVTPSGSGTQSGADWNNAFNKLPTTLVRGDTYYLADGSYGAYTVNTTGSTLVTIKKAIASDHCTDTGWNTGTLGSSQAVFQRINIDGAGGGSNVTFDGNGNSSTPFGCGNGMGAARSSSPATPSDCGIKVDNSSCSSPTLGACDYPIQVGTPYGVAVTGLTFRYFEWKGNNQTSEESFLQQWGPSIHSVYTLDHIYGHNFGCNPTHNDGSTWTIKNSLFWGVVSSADCHGDGTYNTGGVNHVDEHYTMWRDFNGTAIHWFDNSTFDTAIFYGNVYWVSDPATAPVGSGDGMVGIGNGANALNFVFSQNTIVNQQGSWNAGLVVLAPSTCTNCVAQNNLWYGANQLLNPESISVHFGTQDHNSFINPPTNNVDYGGTGDVFIQSGGPNPFVNWPSGNFQLASINATWSGGTPLPSPYNVDAVGNTRGANGTWTRGAYQFNSSSSSRPNPPSNLSVVVH